MANLINSDGAGNTFYNYITPVVKGEVGDPSVPGRFDGFFSTALGVKGVNFFSQAGNFSDYHYSFRFPAPGLEMKTGNITISPSGFARSYFSARLTPSYINSNNTDTNTNNIVGVNVNNSMAISASNLSFMVINDYSLVVAMFTDFTFGTLMKFSYLGFTREPSFTGTSIGTQGAIVITRGINNPGTYVRPASVSTTSTTNLASAADAITSPPIVCTPGTTPGVGTATFTDVVIRDAASPNNPVGKLWNCIDMPATCNVGELWKNTGAYDADGGGSAQDVYLCVMPWGERKLGMRVWTENVS